MKRRIAFGSTLIGLVLVGGLLYQALRPKPRRVVLPKHPLRFYDVPKPRVFSHDEFWKHVRARLSDKHAAKIVNSLESNADIRAWAQSVTWGQPDDLHKAKALYDAVTELPHGETKTYPSIKEAAAAMKKEKNKCRTAEEVFAQKKTRGAMFDCDELAHLYVAAARETGLQAFFVYAHPNHACAAVWIDNQSLLVDLQNDKFGATFLKFRILNDIETAALHLQWMYPFSMFADPATQQETRERTDAYYLAVRLCPTWTRLRLHLIYCLERTSYYVAVEREAREVLKLEPSNIEAMKWLALALSGRDKDRESIQVYQTATKLAPKEWDLQVNLALRLSDVGEHEKAIAQMRKALKVSPPHLLGSDHGLLAAMLEDVGRHDEALNTFEKAVRLSPEDTQLCYDVGRRFFARKRFAQAESIFREVLRRAPDQRIAHFYVGMALYHQKKYKEAQKELEQYLQEARRHSADPYISRTVQIVTELQNRKPTSPR